MNDITIKLIDSYKSILIETGTKPISVAFFAKKNKITEAKFYDEVSSFEHLEELIWANLMAETVQKIEEDEVYATYSVREKLLSFYYTHIEVLKQNRSFALLNLEPFSISKYKNLEVLNLAKIGFKDYLKDLLAEGRESQEVIERLFISDKYPDAFWVQYLIILDFWIKDNSKGFEKTDTAIEKSVNASFDLIGPSPLDSLFDVAKFFYQNR